jgi:hypothetical protein
MDSIIHCIGDSHVSFFSGYDEIQPNYPAPSRNRYRFFKTYRLGAVLAYRLNKLDTREQGREKLLQLKKELPLNSTVLLCFGEIDCRCHLIKQSEVQGKHIEEIVKDCVSNYFEVVDELTNAGYKVMVWNVVPTSESVNAEYPTYGGHIERNRCTAFFNGELSKECERRGLAFVSIFEKLVSRDLKTHRNYFFDAIHLGQIAMPFALQAMANVKHGIILPLNPYTLWFSILTSRVRFAWKNMLQKCKCIIKRILGNKL